MFEARDETSRVRSGMTILTHQFAYQRARGTEAPPSDLDHFATTGRADNRIAIVVGLDVAGAIGSAN